MRFTTYLLRTIIGHIGFHLFWIIVYTVGVLAQFLPAVYIAGIYLTMVLGFVGYTTEGSHLIGIGVGLLIFLITGVISGCVIAAFRPKSVAVPVFASLVVTVLLLLALTSIYQRHLYRDAVARYSAVSVEQREELDDIATLLKIAYYPKPLVPPYVAKSSVVIPISSLEPVLKDLGANDSNLAGKPYSFYNLPPEAWRTLRNHEPARYPLVWTAKPETMARRAVIVVDLKSHIFSVESLDEPDFMRLTNFMETVVTSETSNVNGRIE